LLLVKDLGENSWSTRNIIFHLEKESMRHHKSPPLLYALTVVLLFPLLTVAGEALTADEIEVLFANKTFEGIHLKNGWTFRNYANSDGSCHVHFLTGKKSGQSRIYRWFIKDNMHCCDTGRRHICGTITDEGNGIYHKYRDRSNHIQTFTNFVEGKQIE